MASTASSKLSFSLTNNENASVKNRPRKRQKQASVFKLDSSSEDEGGSDEERATAEAISRAVNAGGCQTALEDAAAKVKRLKSEGNILAEAGKFWQAIQRWNGSPRIYVQGNSRHDYRDRSCRRP